MAYLPTFFGIPVDFILFMLTLASVALFDESQLPALLLRYLPDDWKGGSMICFGSSACVALVGMFPRARSVGARVTGGSHVAGGYLIGLACLPFSLGWHPDADLRSSPFKNSPAPAHAATVIHKEITP